MQMNSSYFQFGRRYIFVALFALLLVLAGLSLVSQQVSAGTIPPGGTVPGGTIPPMGQGQVNIIHVAPFAVDVSDTAVDVCTQANIPVTGATNLHYLEQSGFLTLPVGTYDWQVMQPGCGLLSLIVDVPAFVLNDQAQLTLLILGDGVNQPYSTVLLVQRPGLSNKVVLPIIYKS